MKNLPTLLAGPILRRCSYKSITIWLATSKKMKNLTATVKTYETKRAKSFPVKTIRKEIQVGKSLWIYLLNVQPNTPQKEFPTETVLAYNIGTKKRKDDLGIDKIEGFNIKEFAYAPYKLPTLILQNPESKNFNTLYGSCRKPHGPGHDAAHAANEKIKQEVSNKNKRPSALLLGGDQMYADDVAASMIRPIQTVATKLFGLEEPLPGVENPYEILVNGRLNVIHSKAKFTSGESHNHLMTFGEFCATYVLAWNDKVWDKKFLSAKALTEEMTAEEIPEDYDAFFANEKKKLEEYIKGAKAFKRVLANTPTYMIFDDHEITDDWNLNPLWTKRVRSSKLGKRIVANGLAAFWLFQALGNHPTYYGNKVNDLSKVIKGHVDNIHDPQSKEAKEFDKRTRAYYDKWSFVTETYPKVLFTNLRTRRSSTKMKYLDEQKNTGARLMNTGELSRIRKMLTEMISDDERIIIVTPTPVFGLWTLELAQNIGSKYDAALVDNESFMADPKSLYDLMDVLLKLPIRPKAVTFLSGDVHYGFSVSGMISSPKRKNKVPIPIAQFTSSPMKNLTEGGLSTVLGVIQKKAIDSFDEIYLRHWLKKNKDEFAIDADRIRTSIAKHLLFWPEEIPDLLDIYRFHIQSKGDLFEMRNNIGYFEMTAKNIKNQLLVWTNSGLKTSMKTNWRILKDVWPVQFPEGTLERFHYYIQQPESKTIQKPFYMIANCCNDVGHIRKVMNRGFNAMEIDLRMNDSGEIIADFTGAYSWSTLWTDWLQEAESLPKRLSNKLALLMLDIKEYNPKLVEKLRDSLRKSRLRNTPRVFCVEDIDAGKKTFTKKFISSLNEKESISIFYSESPLDVLDWMNSTKKLANGKGWYADGINTLKIGHSQYAIDRNLRAGMRLRDQGDFSKIFSWTYEKNSSVIEKILSGCDGLVVNTGSGEKGSGQGTYYKWALDYEKIMNKMSSIVRWATKADF